MVSNNGNISNLSIPFENDIIYNDLFLFERAAIADASNQEIDLFNILKHYENTDDLSPNELSVFFCIKNYIDITREYKPLFENCFNILKKNLKIKRDSNYIEIFKIVQMINHKYKLDLSAEDVTLKLLTLWVLYSFNNKFTYITLEDSYDREWFYIHHIADTFIQMLNSFYVFFNHTSIDEHMLTGVRSAPGVIKQNNETIMFMLMLLSENGCLIKTTKQDPNLIKQVDFNKKFLTHVKNYDDLVDKQIKNFETLDEISEYFENQNSNDYLDDINILNELKLILKTGLKSNLEEKEKELIKDRIKTNITFVFDCLGMFNYLEKHKNVVKLKIPKFIMKYMGKFDLERLTPFIKNDRIDNFYKKNCKFVKKGVSKKDCVKKHTFYSLNFKSIYNNNLFIGKYEANFHINTYFSKLKLVKYDGSTYLISVHYSSTCKIFREGKSTNKGFVLKNFDFINIVSDTKYYLNRDQYNSF